MVAMGKTKNNEINTIYIIYKNYKTITFKKMQIIKNK